MNRRRFFHLLGIGAVTVAAEQAIPFNRVWSFPTKIVVPESQMLTVEWITMEHLRILKNKLQLAALLYPDVPYGDFNAPIKVGDTITIKGVHRQPRIFGRDFDHDLVLLPA